VIAVFAYSLNFNW